MKTSKQFITGLLLIFLSLSILAQEEVVVFAYDNSGNRISRTIVWDENINDSAQINIDSSYIKSNQIIVEELVKHSASFGKQTVNIFPNPNHGVFNITIDGWQNDMEAEIWIHNLSGSVILEKNLKLAETQVQFSEKPNGTYILTITVEGKKANWKVIKK